MYKEVQVMYSLTDNELSRPDIFEYNVKGFNVPSDDYVISRDEEGNIISCFGDNIWNFEPYARYSDCKKKFNFNIKSFENIDVNIFKKLVFLVMIFIDGKKGSSLSISTLDNYYDLFKAIIFFIKDKKIKLNNLFLEEKYLFEFVSTRCTQLSFSLTVISFINFLDRMDNRITGIRFKTNRKVLSYLKEKIFLFKKNLKQTSPIPFSILNNSIKIRWEQFTEMNDNIKNLSSFLNSYLSYYDFAMSDRVYNNFNSKKKSKFISWSMAVSSYGLDDLFKKYNINSRRKFKSFIVDINGTGKHLVHAFSGMRNSEALSLMLDCLEIDKSLNITKLVGITTKLEGREKRTQWVSCREISLVINVLTSINTQIYDYQNIKETYRRLFVSPSLISNEKKTNNSIAKYRINNRLPLDESKIQVTENIIEELSDIDPTRDWYSELKVGDIWEFKSHQYRRSLAIYAIRSGLVNLGALQIQFKHLFKEMSLYYGNGSSFAKRLFNVNKNHITYEFDKLKPELEALTYIKEVLFSEEKLYGIHGSFIENSFKNKKLNYKEFILESRVKTVNKFKNGYISYKNTALGGCISIDKCDARLTRSITKCLECNLGVIKSSNLEKVILNQERFVNQLNVKSIEYRTEVEDLEKLKKIKKGIL